MQQINLYQAQFKPKQIPLHPKLMLQIVVIVIAIFTLISFYNAQKNSVLEGSTSQTQRQNSPDIDTKSLDTPFLHAQLDDFLKKNKQKQSLLHYLTQHDLGNQLGFSETLSNLSQQRIHNVWLTSFSFIGAGDTITLDGKSVDSSQIPLYIDKLARSEHFKGKQFSVFELQQADDTGIYRFKLHTNNKLGK